MAGCGSEIQPITTSSSDGSSGLERSAPISVSAGNSSSSEEEEQKIVNEQQWKEMYKELLSDDATYLGFEKDKVYTISLTDLNEDSIPELYFVDQMSTLFNIPGSGIIIKRIMGHAQNLLFKDTIKKNDR